MSEQDYDTLRIHAGYRPKEHLYASSVPIYETAAFGLGDAQTAEEIAAGVKKDRYSYSRVGNPTVKVLEDRIAALEGGIGAVAVSSGMAAISYAILNVAEGGGRIIAPINIYGASLDEFRTLLPKFNINFDFYDEVNDLKRVKQLIRPNTKAIYVESIANPSTEIADIEGLAKIAHAAGIPLIVDNTLPTSYLFRPFTFGADVVVYSSTKGINGHGNAISGLIVDHGQFDWTNGHFPQFTEDEFILTGESQDTSTSFSTKFGANAFIARIKMKYARLFGGTLGPFDAYLALLGLETISERLTKEVHNATAIAQYLQTNSHIEQVYYSGIDKADPLLAKYFPKGIGGILSFKVAGNEEQTKKILDQVKIFNYLPNIGDVRSLIVNPTRVTHREIPKNMLLRQHLTNEVLRLSIGLENVENLISDLDQAITKAFQ
ncbi:MULTISPECIES: O-acetylhomoserine aminocarboxypropyltransferase/cysteine synthase family protein [Loigolactobacillus]|uniref:homocysteine desulfhydrase n=1 Tax=Loigolactobacillus backii TaxID=375175 RepID=A0A192H237_9LACO|nr:MULTISPECIES: aminotransferase class I/II-fold pyridoxal phosphate-dependent enzyme [Loigolactobacillus]ANK60514.1 O-acetylhomoserine aminocarboxypropyltransferase [Loigolactobacillus backii]ANK62011.1 O-acetylhomoserine aminocarboxypropyltransferase [Loigolactobacillus backii]ANK65372.1 O-acetylhomoserine aminocarboxypropyltransferase [Loigolactobacillus backii]ANK67920.1 O-acetylhomoserine aminocarboxypropyltransferase [Loigolactobacillus backii]ANK68795.1 O-acetylhomoserine aminocarboxyp